MGLGMGFGPKRKYSPPQRNEFLYFLVDLSPKEIIVLAYI